MWTLGRINSTSATSGFRRLTRPLMSNVMFPTCYHPGALKPRRHLPLKNCTSLTWSTILAIRVPPALRIPSDKPLCPTRQLGDSDRYKRCSIVQYFLYLVPFPTWNPHSETFKKCLISMPPVFLLSMIPSSRTLVTRPVTPSPVARSEPNCAHILLLIVLMCCISLCWVPTSGPIVRSHDSKVSPSCFLMSIQGNYTNIEW